MRFRTLALVSVLVGAIVLLSACAPATPMPGGNILPQEAGPTPSWSTSQVPQVGLSPAPRPTKSADCPDVESALVHIATAPDPAAAAIAQGYRVEGDRILVLIESTSNTADWATYSVEITSRSSSGAQAWVPVTRLCELGALPEITMIRLPQTAVIQ